MKQPGRIRFTLERQVPLPVHLRLHRNPDGTVDVIAESGAYEQKILTFVPEGYIVRSKLDPEAAEHLGFMSTDRNRIRDLYADGTEEDVMAHQEGWPDVR